MPSNFLIFQPMFDDEFNNDIDCAFLVIPEYDIRLLAYVDGESLVSLLEWK